jgi:hypothetical protein
MQPRLTTPSCRSSRQCHVSYGVKVPCRQLPDSDGKHIRCTGRQRPVFCSEGKAMAALETQSSSGGSDLDGEQTWGPEHQ